MSRGNHSPAPHQSLRAAKTEEGLVRVEASSGILPPPHELKALEEVCPGAANRLLAMAELQLANRHTLEMADSKREDRAVEVFAADMLHASKERSRGQWIAAGLVLLSLGSSVTCAVLGHDTVAGVLAGGSITTVVTAFVLGRPPKTQQTSKTEANA